MVCIQGPGVQWGVEGGSLLLTPRFSLSLSPRTTQSWYLG